MFGLKTKTPKEHSVADQVIHDLHAINTDDPVTYREQLIKVTRALIKGIIGKTHEYTFEESLFILREEGYITEEHYEELKRTLLKLAFLKYSRLSDPNLRQYLDDICAVIIRLAPVITCRCNDTECMNVYRKDMKSEEEKSTASLHARSKQYKREILETERQITEEFASEITHALNDTAEKQEQQEHAKALPTIDVPFDYLFEITTGYDLSAQRSMTSEDTTSVWQLYTKFYLLKGDAPKKIAQRLIERGLSEQDADRLLKEHHRYLDDIRRYSYLQDLMEVILGVALRLIIGKSVDEMIDELARAGYENEMIIFVLSQILVYK
jgi:hypothetical protein